jgi:phosphopantetheine adenylyltransferase
MEPFAARKSAVENFFRTFNPRLHCNVFELKDVAGVGAILPEVQACILTRETAKGGEMVN